MITDISMPFMNGLELVEALQKEGINSKNIIISGYDEFSYARQAISLGVKNYLLKPFLPKELIAENNLKFTGLDLEWMASQVHFSSSYVRQIFKQSTKESFNEYVIRKRMEQTGLLLQKTNLRIQEIAEECGYENQRYFASRFKKFYGCTPTEFKKIAEQDHLY